MPKVYTLNRVRPVVEGEWIDTRTYLELSVVYDHINGNSYTSRIPVPLGVPLTNSTYWVKTSDFNAQLITKGNYYNNVADMKADNSLTVGMTCVTKGYTTPNDRGSALYEIVTGVFLESGQYHRIGTSDKYAKLIPLSNINIIQFGALGGGVHDDTLAITDAIEFAKNSGISLFVPSGIYNCNLDITGCGDIGLCIYGEGTRSSIFTSTTGTTITMREISVDESRHSLRNISLTNLKILGNSNVQAFNIAQCQHLYFTDVRIEDCRLGAFYFNDTYDSSFINVDILNCAKANSDSDFAYAIYFDDHTSNNNNLKFINCRLEHCGLMLRFHGGRHNTFVNCKFEKAQTNNTASYNVFKFVNTKECNFVTCIFTNGISSGDAVKYTIEPTLYFVQTEVNDTLGSERNVLFDDCHFTTNGVARVRWFVGVNTIFDNTTFNYPVCDDDTIYAFNLLGNVTMNCKIVMQDDTRLMALSGNNNHCNLKLYVKGANTKAMCRINTGVDNNSVLYETIDASNLTIPIDVSSTFLANGFNNLLNNVVKDINKKSISEVTNTLRHGCRIITTTVTTLASFNLVNEGDMIYCKFTNACTVTNSAFMVCKTGANTVYGAGTLGRFIFMGGIFIEL